MAYEKRELTDFQTTVDKELLDHMQDGIAAAQLKFPHYNVIGAPHPYVSKLDTTDLATFENVEAIHTAYDELVAQYPLLFKKNEDLGTDASSTYVIRHYTLGMLNPTITTDRPAATENLWSDTEYPRKRLLLNGNIHGANEKYSCLGCYLLVKEILGSTEEWAMFIKNNLLLDIVPICNPWGYENDTNLNANGSNLNRTYLSSIQPENQILIDLIADLTPKGLAGVIDFHNCASSTGYLVGKPTYTRWKYYAVLTSQLEIITHEAFKAVNGSDQDFFFHLWDATGNSGQLHQYVNNIGLLGCTFEVATKLGLGGSLLTKSLGANIINAFATYEGN